MGYGIKFDWTHSPLPIIFIACHVILDWPAEQSGEIQITWNPREVHVPEIHALDIGIMNGTKERNINVPINISHSIQVWHVYPFSMDFCCKCR